MTAEHIPVQVACRVLDVSASGFYAWLSRPPSRGRPPRLADRSHHQGTSGLPRHLRRLRVHAELRLGHGIVVGHNAVGLVDRDFTRGGPNQLWVTDITYVPAWSGWL